MVNLEKKRRILLQHIDGTSITQIAKNLGITRNTARKYIDEYEVKCSKLATINKNDDASIQVLVEALSSSPKYDTSNRSSYKLTDEIKELIDECLKDNEFKLKTHNRKQIMKAVDIHEYLELEGFDIGYTTVCTYIKNNKARKEAYIKQVYALGNTLEYDWGEVKLNINGEIHKYQMALLTTAAASCHYAKLYSNQKMESFLDSHINAFNYFGGVHREVVYDNMKVAVRRFVSKTEKEATEDLIKLSMYYGFDYRFCNARRGNEKGHVERGIEFVRRKAFSKTDEFKTLEDANNHLSKTLEMLNKKKRKWLLNKSPLDILIDEREKFIPLKTDFIISKKLECRVDKYSTITIEQNRYSVPDNLVGKFIYAKIHPEKIVVMVDDTVVATHTRSFKNHEWIMDINHYLSTIKKKPGSLKNSAAMHSSDHRIQYIYNKYYTRKAKEFIELLEIIKDKGIQKVEQTIEELGKLGHRHITTENIKNIINQKSNPAPEAAYVDENDEIRENSLLMLKQLTDALLDTEMEAI
jgi:transposase